MGPRPARGGDGRRRHPLSTHGHVTPSSPSLPGRATPQLSACGLGGPTTDGARSGWVRGRREVSPVVGARPPARRVVGDRGSPHAGQVSVSSAGRPISRFSARGRDPRDLEVSSGPVARYTVRHAPLVATPHLPSPRRTDHESHDRVLHAVKLPPAGGRSDCRVARGLPRFRRGTDRVRWRRLRGDHRRAPTLLQEARRSLSRVPGDSAPDRGLIWALASVR